MSINQIRESGILESFVLGDLDDSQRVKLDKAIGKYPDLKQDIIEIERSLEKYAHAHGIEPNPTEKPMLMATLNYNLRLESGEEPSNPPVLHPESKISDYKKWLDRPDLQEPSEYDVMHGFIIGATAEKSTLIVWLKNGAPDETHTDELETFLVVEGTCMITIGDQPNNLKAGDVLTIPLHISHRVDVTSEIACKIILERKAA